MTEEIKKDKKKKVTKTVTKRGDKKPATKASRIFRGPLFWIVFAIIAVSVFGQISGAGSAFTKVNTSQILDAIAQSEVKSATVIDKDQVIRVELKPGRTINGSSQVEASYVIRQEPTIIDALSANPPLNGWNIEVPKTSLLVSFLFSLAPILIIGLLFFFLLSQSQGGNKVFSFGKSRAKLQSDEVPKTT
jgi:cell division protease FtsH